MRKLLFLFLGVSFVIVSTGLIVVYKRLHRPKPQPVEIKPKPEVKITLLEGWTVIDVSKAVEARGLYMAKDFLDSEKNFDSSAYPNVFRPHNADLEGYLFPDTYQVFEDSTPGDLIRKMLTNFEKKWSALEPNYQNGQIIVPGFENQKFADSLPGITPYEVLTLASIIEKETGRDLTNKDANSLERLLTERKTVAGIFYNRLKIGMALESDATINYITKSNQAQATIEQTKIKSPYNTYLNPGLPPGPICNPSAMSIEAALNPIKTDYYFFLHKQPSGEVVYSKTLDEHIKNKYRFLR